jgi:putative hemolysin
VDEGQPKQLRGGAIEVDGLLNLDDFAEQTGIELPEGPYETVAGYMLAMLGQLPTGHEAVEIGGHRLTVLAMDGRRIARVRVDPAEPDGDASSQDGAPASRDGVIPSLAAPTAAAAPPSPVAPPASGAPPATSAPDGSTAPAAPPSSATSPGAPPKS